MNALVPVTVQPDDLEVVQRTARLLAVSGYFDAKGDTPTAIAQVATKILAGRELGFGPFAAVNGIYIIQGRPAVGANLMAAAVKGSGRYDYRVKTMTDTECSLEFFAVANGHRESLGVSTFTAKDAKAAGTKNLDKFPRNMLFARAMSNGVRWYCPDVFSGNAVYVPEELGADVDGDGNVVNGSVRTVDAATGEILPHAAATPRSAPPQPPHGDVDLGMAADRPQANGPSSDANPFEDDAPWYVAARGQLTNGVAKFADAALGYHRDGGPASAKQYGYLAGLIDQVVKQATGAEDSHRRVLAVLCQAEITNTNPPSATLASKLLDKLATHKLVNGEKIANAAYDQAVADAMVAVYRAAEAVGTPTLFETA